MKKAEIWLENSKSIDITYTSFTSCAHEQAYFFMIGKDNIAIVPWRYLITFIG
jgi:hypothetical protein